MILFHFTGHPSSDNQQLRKNQRRRRKFFDICEAIQPFCESIFVILRFNFINIASDVFRFLQTLIINIKARKTRKKCDRRNADFLIISFQHPQEISKFPLPCSITESADTPVLRARRSHAENKQIKKSQGFWLTFLSYLLPIPQHEKFGKCTTSFSQTFQETPLF